MRLILLRHAKSSWKTNASSDHERPLNKRGRRDAPTIAETLLSKGWIPELVLCSSAARTQETWLHMEGIFPGEIPIQFLPTLYHASAKTGLQTLSHTPKAHQTVLMLGHNPGWESLLEVLCGESHKLTTTNAALLSVDAEDWVEATTLSGAWTLHDILRPRVPR